MTEPVIVTRTATPEGHEIVLTAVRWAKVIEGHPETVDYLDTILQLCPHPTIESPTSPWGASECSAAGGPSAGLRVVIDLEQIITALRRPTIPSEP